jgi:hypothetical protein
MALTHDIVEVARPQARGKRRSGLQPFFGGGGEQIVGHGRTLTLIPQVAGLSADRTDVRDVLVLLFWCWCAVSVVILIRRVLKRGAAKSGSADVAEVDPQESFEARLLQSSEIVAPAAPRAATLAEALEGISLPVGLVPVVNDRVDPRNMLFSTSGHPPEAVGTGLADEVERLGFTIQPVDDETIQAVKGGTDLEIRIHPDIERARMRVGATLATLPESSIVVQMRLR